MEYQQCGPICPQTCNFETSDCYSGCAEGCFCPRNTVLMYGECTNKANCPGKSCVYDYIIYVHYCLVAT